MTSAMGPVAGKIKDWKGKQGPSHAEPCQSWKAKGFKWEASCSILLL